MCSYAQKNVQTISPSDLIQPFTEHMTSTSNLLAIALHNNPPSAIKPSGMDLG
jgi:hypothetical protein